ncbi:unnamed protein product [Camellia sinensis]
MKTKMAWKSSVRELRHLIHLLLPLFIHWIAEEMTVSVLVDVTTRALCPGESTCSEAIYINGVQQTVVGIFKMVVLPILGQLADEYGRKPLLILTLSTTIVPFDLLLAINESKASVYGYYVLHTISYIISQGSIFCISVAYVADVVEEDKRAALFSWITGIFSFSHVLGNVLARFLPEDYIFEVSIALLVFCPIYMHLFLVETVQSTPRHRQHDPWLHKALKIVKERYNSMRHAATIVVSSPTLKGMSLVSFFYELGMSGISSVLLIPSEGSLWFQQKSIFRNSDDGGNRINCFPESDTLHSLNFINSLCIGLWLGMGFLASVLKLHYGVPYLSASFGVIYVLVKPSTYAIISRASSSADQGKAQAFIAGVQSIADLLSPLAMSPLTSWFLSSDAPFNCKGFSIVLASSCMVISLCCACMLKREKPSKNILVDNGENIEAPLLS